MSVFSANKEATEAVEKSLIERAAAETAASLARHEQANSQRKKPNTCSTCKHWLLWHQSYPIYRHGICAGMKNNMVSFALEKPWSPNANVNHHVVTAAEFGCILHEPES